MLESRDDSAQRHFDRRLFPDLSLPLRLWVNTEAENKIAIRADRPIWSGMLNTRGEK
jgi:hypothetical protein